MKFRKGDRIKVKSRSRVEGGAHAGKEGIVESVHRGTKWPYGVILDRGPQTLLLFNAHEIEAAS